MVEQVICNHQVGGSIPLASSTPNTHGEVLKRSTRADCKSVGYSLRRFESFPPHPFLHSYSTACGSSSVGRALAFQANCRGFKSRLPLRRATTRISDLCGETRQDRACEHARRTVARWMANNSSERCRRWLNWHDWKSCVQATVPWVRIPLSPPYYIFGDIVTNFPGASRLGLVSRSNSENISERQRSCQEYVGETEFFLQNSVSQSLLALSFDMSQ